MNLGEFRRRTSQLPDDTDLLGDLGDLEMHELTISHIFSPVLEHSFAVVLVFGQVVNYELDIDDRIDAAHIYGDWEDQQKRRRTDDIPDD